MTMTQADEVEQLTAELAAQRTEADKILRMCNRANARITQLDLEIVERDRRIEQLEAELAAARSEAALD